MILNMLDFETMYFDMFFAATWEHRCSKATSPCGTQKYTILRALKNLQPDLLVPHRRRLGSFWGRFWG